MHSVSQNSITRTLSGSIYNGMVTEEGQDYLDYLTRVGLLTESNMLVLSMRHHHYFDNNDLSNLRVLVILKKLNYIKHLDGFLHILYRVLPSEGYFIGCFTESKSPKGIGFSNYSTSTNSNKFVNFLDSNANLLLDKNDVLRILESHGFKIVDMTEINGQVYFKSQNKRISVQLT
jgi:hypothetical protein